MTKEEELKELKRAVSLTKTWFERCQVPDLKDLYLDNIKNYEERIKKLEDELRKEVRS